ncbi:MAG: hypothetical protein R3Y38_03060 [Rikenellaceae bacterium]
MKISTFFKSAVALVAVALLSVSTADAQTFQKGDNDISLGVGYGWGLPIEVSYERGVYDINETMSIGVGGTFGFATKKYSNYRFTDLFFGVNGMFHYFMWENWDLSAGVTLGYEAISAKNVNTGDKVDSSIYSSGLLFGFTANAKYYFNENWAVFAQAGYSIAYIKIGATYKF